MFVSFTFDYSPDFQRVFAGLMHIGGIVSVHFGADRQLSVLCSCSLQYAIQLRIIACRRIQCRPRRQRISSNCAVVRADALAFLCLQIAVASRT